MTTTTTHSNTSGPQPIERLSHYDPEVRSSVSSDWLASGQPLAWIPILSQENFPDTPIEVLQLADRYQTALRWPIYRPQDLLELYPRA
ncbi:MAG: hypothetical protein KatS3mg128_0165 [Silanimonas sp.]|nr:MAG: hypothetical protein KatS3mg128_0165 [Silanimonas sp.]